MSGSTEEDFAIAVDREIGLRGHLVDLVPLVWPIVEPYTDYKHNWHIDVICEHLEAVSNREIRDLLINVPPGCMKSLLVQVVWDVWEWIRRPGTKFISASFDPDLTLRDARRVIQVVTSDFFQARWGDRVTIAGDVAASDFFNFQGGWKFATSVKGKGTGRHCDIFKTDDPHKPLAISKVTLGEAKDWWHGTVPTRFADPKTGRKVMIMQRLHENDLSGEFMAEGCEHLRLPMRFEAKACSYTSIGGDMRITEGELLWPERFGPDEVARLEKSMGSRESAAQFQQRPAPQEGAIFKSAWFKHYLVAPARFDQVVQSWDCAFKDADDSDYVCGQVWGVIGAEFYLLDQFWQRVDLVETCKAVERMTRMWPKAVMKFIEDKANGPAVISVLKKKVVGLIEVNPEGGKVARANAVAPIFEAGNVWLPDPSIAPWIDGYEVEMTTFPYAANDDRVDATTQALVRIHGKMTDYKAAMEKAKTMGLL